MWRYFDFRNSIGDNVPYPLAGYGMKVCLGGMWFAEGAVVGSVFLELGILVKKEPGFGEEGAESVVESFGVG